MQSGCIATFSSVSDLDFRFSSIDRGLITMSTTEHVIMRARYRTTFWNPGMLGVLIMTEDEIAFAPDDPMPPMELTQGFKQITSHQCNKEGSWPALLKLTHEESGDYIFEFYNSSERNVCRDFVGRVLGKLQTMQSSVQDTKVSEKTAVPIHDEQLSTKEIQFRIKLQHENNELQKLHKQFVIGGMLTEAEFWVMRKIFTEKPAVHQAFLNFVPNKMTEKDFWTKYCKAEYLHATNNVVAAATEAAEDEEQYDIFSSEARRKMRRADRTLDMEADEEDGYILLPVSGLLSDKSQVKGIVDETKQVITNISTRKKAERTKAEDFDAEAWELLEAENEQEEEVFDQVGRMGTLINKFKASF